MLVGIVGEKIDLELIGLVDLRATACADGCLRAIAMENLDIDNVGVRLGGADVNTHAGVVGTSGMAAAAADDAIVEGHH